MSRFFIVLFIFFAIAIEAKADCLCNEKICMGKDFSKSALVFRGKVEKKIWINTHDYVLEVRIQESWKGIQSSGYVEIVSNNSEKTCDYQFITGRDYLIYAYETEDNDFAVGKCGPTMPWSEVAEEDLITLGKPAYEEQTE